MIRHGAANMLTRIGEQLYASTATLVIGGVHPATQLVLSTAALGLAGTHAENFDDPKILKDYGGNDRVLSVRRRG